MNKIKKGDKVKILLGKDSGREGSVEKVLTKESRVIVGGINISKRSVKKFNDTQGGIVDLVKPVDISNVALVCPNCKKPTRVGFLIEKGVKVRICRKCKKENKR
jgi:large subunit ribosomal protein L24